jgi:hypothetical protein
VHRFNSWVTDGGRAPLHATLGGGLLHSPGGRELRGHVKQAEASVMKLQRTGATALLPAMTGPCRMQHAWAYVGQEGDGLVGGLNKASRCLFKCFYDARGHGNDEQRLTDR